MKVKAITGILYGRRLQMTEFLSLSFLKHLNSSTEYWRSLDYTATNVCSHFRELLIHRYYDEHFSLSNYFFIAEQHES